MRTLFPLLLLAVPTAVFAAAICFVPSPNGRIDTVDCDQLVPGRWPNAYTGYSFDLPPCRFDACYAWDWGSGRMHYEWSISSSSTDPSVNQGAFPEGESTLYLWIACAQFDGAAGAEFSLETDDPALTLTALTPEPYCLNAGSVRDPVLAIGGCPGSLVRIASLTVDYDPTPVETASWGSVKALYR